MNENTQQSTSSALSSALESRSRELFGTSVESLDMRICSRLTRARAGAVERAAMVGKRPWLQRWRLWTPAAGLTAAVLVGVALWVGTPGSQAINHAPGDAQTNLEDLDMVAASDGTSGDAMEMLQDDIDFYDFADKAASAGPAA